MEKCACASRWAEGLALLGLVLLLLAGCTGEDRRCRIFCQGGCGKVEGCDCGDCDPGYECTGENKCVVLCVPECDGKTCGDDGCGGTCGGCGCGHECVGGACAFTACDYRECGDDGCGDSCGDCENSQASCVAGVCECAPACDGLDCGPDGCGGKCGKCPCGEDCEGGACVFHACDGKVCGDDGCDGSCGQCASDQEACVNGACHCTPGCGGKNCGDDGCGGSCGECACGKECLDWICVDVACDGKECGDNGCGKSCGACGCEELCEAGLCAFHGCDGKVCGGDGCGGSCGACGCGEECQLSQCVFTACDGLVCGADGCEGSCGECAPGLTCLGTACQCQDGNGFDWDGCTNGAVTEFQVNSFVLADQRRPAVAGLQDGGWVIAWESCPSGHPNGAVAQDGDGCGVYLQRYGADGWEQGDEIPVAQTTAGDQWRPAVAGISDGGFVVVWEGADVEGGTNVYSRRYLASGAPLGGEVTVNSTTQGNQAAPAVAGFAGGGWFVVWEHQAEDGDWDIRAQRYVPDGMAQGTEITVNTETALDQRAPAIHIQPDHRFTVTWQSGGLSCGPCYDGQFHGIAARRFKAGGDADGDEVLVNSYTSLDQMDPAIGGTPDGGALVLWSSGQAFPYEFSPDGSGYGVFGQGFDPDGAPVGDEHGLNQFSLEEQQAAAVAGRPGGDYVATWESCPTSLPGGGEGQDGDGCAVIQRRIAADGSGAVDEAVVSVWTDGPQRHPAVAAFADGGYILVWESCPDSQLVWDQSQDGNWCGIFAQRYFADGTRRYH
ncbi:MAG: hypothetical protein ABIK09_13460 [Pseudomonadota bacterium]